MYLLFPSKHLAYAFIWGSFMNNGDGKALPSCLYPIYYLNESLPCDFLSDNGILLISTSLILIGFLLLWKVLLMMLFSPKCTASCSIFILWKEKKPTTFFILIF